MNRLGYIIFLFCSWIFAQPISLEYIFQEPQLINPRPSLKHIHAGSGKIFYYADDDFDGRLDMFDYSYRTGEMYRYLDTGMPVSEFVILPAGDCIAVIGGDVYLSKNFASTRTFTQDLQLTHTDGYEYSPLTRGNNVIYRRGGNYYITRFDQDGKKYHEAALTTDESDSISNQLLALEEVKDAGGDVVIRLLFARYNNSRHEEFIFPDYTGEFVTTRKNKRGVPEIDLFQLNVSLLKGDSLAVSLVNRIDYPGEEKFLTIYSDFSPDAASIVLDVETLDRHNRKLFIFDIVSKSLKEIYSETDEAWYERHDNYTLFIGSSDIVFSSEKSGFNGIYRISKDGSGERQIAGGSYSINESVVDVKKGKVYFTANKERPYEYFIYETGLDGTDLKQITTQTGEDGNLKLSSEGEYLIYEHSYINKPHELYYVRLQDHTSQQITNTVSAKFSSVNWKIPEVITFQNEEDQATIYALLYKPDNFDAGKKYPLICFAHGDGYLQNVTFGMSHYRDNFMAYTYFTQQGYMVLDVDFRGSKGYGKDFRNKTYQNLGKWEVSDFVSGINFLNSKGYIDKSRVGIYGGSYGGFTTLMAAFNNHETFAAAIALRPVCNWKNYYYSNKRYTVPRLGDYFNEDDKKNYEISSPITYADMLQIPLLIIHGMQDDNVFFQDAVQLTQKLISSGKDFEVMFYPEESHSFRFQSSWLDSYKRIYKFFEKNLLRN